MLIKNITKSIIDGIGKTLSDYGFDYSKRNKKFIKSKGNVQQIFELLFYKENAISILVEPWVKIKIKPIEDIYHMVSSKDAKYNDSAITLGNNMGEIIQYYEKGNEKRSEFANMRYLIEDDQDVKVLIKVIPKGFIEFVLPYFDSNSSIIEVDRLLNETPRELSIHHPLYPTRACIGLIAAKLVSNPNYKELVTIYEEETREANPFYREEFERLIKLLDNKY
jgi:hypothetical protein